VNVNDVIELVNNPTALAAVKTAELEKLVHQHPWFQAAHILLAKKYKIDGSPLYQEQLEMAAVLAPDRSYLEQFLSDEDKPSGSEVEAMDQTGMDESAGKVLETLSVRVPLEAPTPADLHTSKQAETHSFRGWLDRLRQDQGLSEPERGLESLPQAESSQQLTTDTDGAMRPEFSPDVTPEEEAAASELARTSAVLSPQFMSETLADLFANQGKFEKAIEVYSALKTRFPEKSGYFAAKIKRLQGPV
jgi:hypothetical protein